MEVQSDEAYIAHAECQVDDTVHIIHADSELVFCQSGCDMCMSVCTNIGVDAEGHTSHFTFGGSQRIDYFQLGDRFHVETKDIIVQSQLYFPVGFSHTGIDNLSGREAGLKSGTYLASAHTVGTHSTIADDGEDLADDGELTDGGASADDGESAEG